MPHQTKTARNRYARECRKNGTGPFKKGYWKKAFVARREQMRAYVRHLRSAPCKDCAVQYPHYVMEFDHRDQQAKLFKVSNAGQARSWEMLLDEIAKCDVVCANCHRERTFQRSAQ